jgi:hypothetical protein
MKKQPCEPQVGADIEVFLFDRDEMEIVPCVGVINGTKDKPFHPAGYLEGYALQEDNVMLEYNIPTVTSGDQMDQAICYAAGMINDQIPAKYGTRIIPEHVFREDQLTAPQAKVVGCEPDFNAYEGGLQRVVSHILGTDRGCGGHIHLGGNFNCPDFVAALHADLMLGVRAACGPMANNGRTAWYGQPGIYRPKPYGIEYRTPDNTWTDDFETRWEVGEMAMVLCNYLTQNDAETIRKGFNGITWTRVRDYMNPANRTTAMYKEILSEATRAGVPV